MHDACNLVGYKSDIKWVGVMEKPATDGHHR